MATPLLPSISMATGLQVGDAVTYDGVSTGFIQRIEHGYVYLTNGTGGYFASCYDRITNAEARYLAAKPPLAPGVTVVFPAMLRSGTVTELDGDKVWVQVHGRVVPWHRHVIHTRNELPDWRIKLLRKRGFGISDGEYAK